MSSFHRIRADLQLGSNHRVIKDYDNGDFLEVDEWGLTHFLSGSGGGLNLGPPDVIDQRIVIVGVDNGSAVTVNCATGFNISSDTNALFSIGSILDLVSYAIGWDVPTGKPILRWRVNFNEAVTISA